MEPLPTINLRLSIERLVIAIFRDDDMGDQRLGRNAGFNQPLGRGRLGDFALAGSAGVFGPSHNQDFEPRRGHIEPFGDILADHMARAAAARTTMSTTISSRQMGGQRAAIGATLARAGLCSGFALLLNLGLRCGESLLDILQHQGELIRVDPFGARSKAMTLKIFDDGGKPLDFAVRLGADRGDFLGVPRSLRHQESAQGVGIRRKSISGEAHDPQ